MKTVSELSERVGGQVLGDGATVIKGVASMQSAAAGEISYVEDEKLFGAASASNAACLIVPTGSRIDPACRIEVGNPKRAFALIAELLHPAKQRPPQIHPSAVIANDAKIAGNA